MTTLAAPIRPRSTTQSGVTFGRLVRSELLKLTSLRSTIVVATLIVVSTVIGLLAFSSHGSALAIASGSAVGVVFIAVLGAMSVPVEVNTGTLQPTYLSAPRRVPALLAKAVVIAAVAGALTLVGNGVGLAVAHIALDGAAIGQLLLSAVAMALTGSMFVFAGAMIRSVPAAVTVAILFSIILQNMVSLVRVGSLWLSDFLPSESAAGLVASTDPGEFVRCLVVLLVWVAGTAIPAIVLLRRRDV